MAKKSIAKTGVHFRYQTGVHFHYHTNGECATLTSEQKKELAELRESLPQTEKAKFKKNKLQKHKIKEQTTNILNCCRRIEKVLSTVSTLPDVQVYIASMVQAMVSDSNKPKENENKDKPPNPVPKVMP